MKNSWKTSWCEHGHVRFQRGALEASFLVHRPSQSSTAWCPTALLSEGTLGTVCFHWERGVGPEKRGIHCSCGALCDAIDSDPHGHFRYTRSKVMEKCQVPEVGRTRFGGMRRAEAAELHRSGWGEHAKDDHRM